MYQDLLKIATHLGHPRILVVGDFILDSYIYGDALRISPEAPVPVLKVMKRESRCGGAASVVADLIELGAQCTCLGYVGNDAKGRDLISYLKEMGADVSGIITVDNRPTISKERIVGLAQHRHRQQLLRIDEEEALGLDTAAFQRLEAAYKQLLPETDVVCLEDYNKGVLDDTFCRMCIQYARQSQRKVLVDPAYNCDYQRYQGANLITPNRKEAAAAAGMEIESISDADQAAEKLAQKHDLQAVVVTLDKEGAYLWTRDLQAHIPTIARNVYDVTGAGDMVLAMLSMAVAAGCEYKTAVYLANIAGGIEVEKFGVATVSIEEIVNEILIQNRGKSGKVRDDTTLTAELEYHRKLGKKIVFTNGCFDVIHRGHIEYLQFCRAHGDIVVVGLNSDASVKMNKGPQRPINNEKDRAAVLAALECVHYVVIFGEQTPQKIIEKVRPDVLVKGEDWAVKGVVGREFVESKGGKVVLAPLVAGKSSTSTIEKMRSLENPE